MTRPRKFNIRKAYFQSECFDELEVYLRDKEMSLNHKEFVLDLAALVDFLEEENYIGAHFLATVLNERLKVKLPEWSRLAKLHVPTDYQVPDVQLDPSLGEE